MIEEESDDADEEAGGLRRLVRGGAVCDDVVDADREAVTDRFMLDRSDA